MLGVRLDAETERRLDALARARGRSRSDVVREALVRYLDGDSWLEECRRQSRLVTAHESEEETLDFLESVADAGDLG